MKKETRNGPNRGLNTLGVENEAKPSHNITAIGFLNKQRSQTGTLYGLVAKEHKVTTDTLSPGQQNH